MPLEVLLETTFPAELAGSSDAYRNVAEHNLYFKQLFLTGRSNIEQLLEE